MHVVSNVFVVPLLWILVSASSGAASASPTVLALILSGGADEEHIARRAAVAQTWVRKQTAREA